MKDQLNPYSYTAVEAEPVAEMSEEEVFVQILRWACLIVGGLAVECQFLVFVESWRSHSLPWLFFVLAWCGCAACWILHWWANRVEDQIAADTGPNPLLQSGLANQQQGCNYGQSSGDS